ncbi:hypothetical protein [Floridanema evergladense]|uniref:Leucine rich repeat variant n=1 Tax=Floridaenema evergladense BLCC-F167 TaxID=3153639 RepID=A0ABV4WJ21_9CYAN
MPLPEPMNEADLQTFLDNPERLASESRDLHLAIANHPTTPRQLLEVLTHSTDPQVAQTARLHVNWAGELTENLPEAVDTELRNTQLGQNDRLAVELLKFAPVPDYFLSEWVPSEHIIQGLHNPHLPSRYRLKLLEKLAKEPTIEPRLQVAESVETPLAILEELAGDLDFAIRLAVKFNAICPPELIELIEAQHAIASDWNSDREQLKTLGQSRWKWIRLAVAQNPSTPAETLMQLARDSVFKIQLAVGRNPQTPTNILEVLIEHPEKAIQGTVVTHPNATEEMLHRLFPTHFHLMKSRQNLPASIIERFFQKANKDIPIWKQNDLRHLLLKQPNTPSEILAQLANVNVEELRAEKLANIQHISDSEILEKWIEDELQFLVNVAKHPQVSREILERLSQYEVPNVQLAVAQNPLTPTDIKMQLWGVLSNHPDDRVKTKVAKDSNTPVSILQTMAENEFYQTKLLREIHRVLASEYKPNASSFESTADWVMFDLKHRVLYPANIRINVDRWMEAIQNFGIVERLIDDLKAGDNPPVLPTFWNELLPGLPSDQLNQTVQNIFDILQLVKSQIKDSEFYRSTAVALVGNPHTPVEIREQLKNQLTQPVKPFSSGKENRDLLLALAYNPAIPEAERLAYFQQLGSQNWQEAVARNPQTLPEILAQMMTKTGVARQAIARNPNAPAWMLAELAQDSNSTTRSFVAENPGTPPEILLQMVRQPVEKTINNVSTVRETVLKNPNFSPLERYRLLLEKEAEQEKENAHKLMIKRPNSPYALTEVIKTSNKETLYKVARNPQTPIQILEQLAKHPDTIVRQVVTENKNITPKLCLELARDSDSSVRARLAGKKLPQQVAAEILTELAKDSSEFVRSNVALNQDTPKEVLSELVKDFCQTVRAKVLNNPNTPSHVITEVILKIQNNQELEKIFPAKNPQLPTELLDRLADNPIDFIRFVVAAHRNTASNTLERLAFDKYNLVRQTVAENPRTPTEILIEMARLDNPEEIGCYHTVSTKIALRKDAPPAALEFIARKPVISIRLDVAKNPNTPSSTLEWLAENETDKDVLCAVVQHQNATSNIWINLARNEIIAVREAVAAQIGCPSDILEMLADDVSLEVRSQIAANPNTPAYIIEYLSQEENFAVRAAAASNPNLSITQLERLAQDEKVEVRRVVAQNNNTPESIRQTLRELLLPSKTFQSNTTLRGLSRIYKPNIDNLPTLLSEYVQSPNAFVRFVALLHPLTPVEVLQQNVKSLSWIERYAIADNPSTPNEIRQQLIQDSNKIVRATAKAVL